MKVVYWKVSTKEECKCKLYKNRQHIESTVSWILPLFTTDFRLFLSVFWICSARESQYLTVSHTLFSCQRKLSISTSVPPALSHPLAEAGALALSYFLSGVIYEELYSWVVACLQHLLEMENQSQDSCQKEELVKEKDSDGIERNFMRKRGKAGATACCFIDVVRALACSEQIILLMMGTESDGDKQQRQAASN